MATPGIRVDARLVALAVFVALAGAQPLSRAAQPNVLLVTIDTLRADRVGAYGYALASTPALDGLARSGVRFADAVAHVPLTLPSHLSMLTGRYPGALGVTVNGVVPSLDGTPTLAQAFTQHGYASAAFVGSAIVDAAYGLDKGFAVYDDDLDPPGGGQVSLSDLQRPAGAVVDRVERWLGQTKGPWFAWVHLYDPHLPYEAPVDYRKKTPDRPYDAEVAYADAMLGRLLAKIDRANTFIVVTSDHGESLGDHDELDHGFFIYDATLKVPLIVTGPGIAARVVNEQVRLVDLMPTMTALAGVRVENAAPDGVSLVPLLHGQARAEVPPSLAESWYPRLHFGWSELRGVRVGDFMFIAAPRPELFDLRSDPGQRTNLVERRAPLAARLNAELARLTTREPAPSAMAPQPDPETVRRLQALGYVGSFTPFTAGGGDDPKDHVKDYRAYRELLNRSLGALDRGQVAAAVPLLQKLVKLNVRAFEAHLYLGNAYAASGKLEAALGEYEAALQLNPEVTTPRIEMAKVLLQHGDADRAVKELQTVLAREPRSFYAWYTLGTVQLKAGRPLEAVRALTEASRLNTRDGRAAANLAEAALRTGQTVLAKEQFERLVALGYRVAPAHYNLGLLALKSGDRAGAANHFRAALKADGGFAPAKEALLKLK